jgi:putative DNA primase/helicase
MNRTASAATIAKALTGRPVKRSGNGNYLVCCPAHDDSSPSLSLRDGDRGLIVHCFAGCEARDVYRAISRKGIDVDRDDMTAGKPAKNFSEDRRRQADKAGWFWSQRKPVIGSIAEPFVRRVRGYSGVLPPTLGFLPPLKPEHHPALIAAFGPCAEPEPGLIVPPQHVTAVHLTLLQPDGSGKANVEAPKFTIGSPLGKPIVLAPPNDLLGLAITEGIEDALAAQLALGLGAWAAGSASFMPALAETVPSYIDAITIFAHPDKAGSDGAHKLATALRQRNIEVTVEGIL